MHCHDGDLVVQLARVGDVLAALGEQLGVGQARGHFGSSLAARAARAMFSLTGTITLPFTTLGESQTIWSSASTSLALRSRSLITSCETNPAAVWHSMYSTRSRSSSAFPCGSSFSR